MNQLRFSIGVPRPGSAARTAEDAADAADAPLHSIRPRAGSAARDAEERKRAEGVRPMQRGSIVLRAHGTPFPETAPIAGPANLTGPQPHVVVERLHGGPMLSPAPSPAPGSHGLSQTGQEDAPKMLHGPLQTAVGQIRSLVQSLFATGSSSSKP